MTKRIRGEGSVRQRADGRWEGRITIGRNPNGTLRRVSVYGRTAEEASARMQEEAVRYRQGHLTEPSTLLVGAYLDRWLGWKRTTCRSRTVEGYQDLVRLHVQPYLGNRRLQGLRPAHVQEWLDRLLADDRGRRTIRMAFDLLSSALKHAVELGLVSRAVTASVRRPAQPERHVEVWSPEEAAAFLGAVDTREHRLFSLFHLALACGLRRGELLGLRVQDVNLVNANILVCQVVAAGRGGVEIGPPKSARSRRVIPLDDGTVGHLAYRLTQLDAERKTAEEVGLWQEHGLLYPSQTGQPLCPRNLRRTFDRLARRAGVRQVSLHALRHTYASLALRAGVPLATLSERLGHHSSAFTLDTYAHVVGAMHQEAALPLDRLLGLESGDVTEDDPN